MSRYQAVRRWVADQGSPLVHESIPSRYATLEEAVRTLRPAQPLQAVYPAVRARQAARFRDGFPGRVIYTLAANPDPSVLQDLRMAGITSFAAKTLAEMDGARRESPDSALVFTAPVKAREDIRHAWQAHGVTAFACATPEESRKIREVTGDDPRVTLLVRGQGEGAFALAREAQAVGVRVGLSVAGDAEAATPLAYVRDVVATWRAARAAGVSPDVMNLEGGFPRKASPESLFACLRDALVGACEGVEAWGMLGRSLVGDSATLVTRVELRKGDVLHVNDGTYGSLSDVARRGAAGGAVRLIRDDARAGRKGVRGRALAPFILFGPTCDSVDKMPGPFLLPDDVQEGDWLAFTAAGAYGASAQTRFNGFFSDAKVEITEDRP